MTAFEKFERFVRAMAKRNDPTQTVPMARIGSRPMWLGTPDNTGDANQEAQQQHGDSPFRHHAKRIWW